MKKIRVFIEKSIDGRYSAFMPDDNNLPFGLIGLGNTEQEAKEDFLSSYVDMKQLLVEKGKDFNEDLEFLFATVE